jgi:type I restriction enzyme M protein
MIEITYADPYQNGRVGVIAPLGVLFRGGTEGKIRRKIIEENLLDAVIGLPPNLFFGTQIPAAILLFRRARLDDRVLFIDASSDFEDGTPQNKLRPQDIDRIVTTLQRRRSVDKYAYIAPFAEIKGKHFSLHIPRYVDSFVPEPEVDIVAVQKEIDDLEQQLAKVQEMKNNLLEELTGGA